MLDRGRSLVALASVAVPTVVLAVAARPAPALAQRATKEDARKAQAHFDRGRELYDLGHFDQAIAEFELAYQAVPDPVFLFNVAQAHRLNGNARRALFIYKRFLALAPGAPNRAEVERHIAALEAEVERDRGGGGAGDPGDAAVDERGAGGGGDTAGEGTGTQLAVTGGGDAGTPAELGGATVTAVVEPFRPIRLAGSAGIAFHAFGPVASQYSGAGGRFVLEGTYSIAFDRLLVDVGALVDAAPTQGTTLLHTFGLLGGRYEVAPRWLVRADLGVGAVHWVGLHGSDIAGSAVGPGEVPSFFATQLRLGAELEVAPRLTVGVPLVATFASNQAIGSGRLGAVNHIRSFEIHFYAGYSL